MLEEMIVTLQLKLGSLWSEEALSERVGIGSTPVREAVKRLQVDSLLQILPRHGLQIAEIDPHEQLQVVDLRRELETFVSVRAAKRALRPERERLRMLAETLVAPAREGDVGKYTLGVLDADRYVAEIGRNPFAARAISPLHALSRRFYFAFYGELMNLRDAGPLHVERARAVADGDEARTRRAGGSAHGRDRALHPLYFRGRAGPT
ncbi:GntR family transcriptional regulator [Belnapia sp. T18]|uniref:GntR family transcriptional regulator n=1 Tax=Belnapia arida TaxID=2804533 RepID=A0ABS1UFJ4_9PROT|nr:GntR family transcriptional regulator [Belnapia arida]MBL6082046.1 GntR family transcriptional regulator [Belnapia arida]